MNAVELPSQFMENFCWDWSVLRQMTAHVKTGEPLPRALFDKLLAAKNFQSGLQTLRQIEFSLFDMLVHSEHDPAQDLPPGHYETGQQPPGARIVQSLPRPRAKP